MKNIPISIFFKKITGFGGGERVVMEEYFYLKKMGFRPKIICFENSSGPEIFKDFDLKVLGSGILGRIRLFYYIKKERNPILSVHSGVIDVFLVSLFGAFQYIYHHHSPVLLHDSVFSPWLYSARFKSKVKSYIASDSENYLYYSEAISAKPPSFFYRELIAFLYTRAISRAILLTCWSRKVATEIYYFYGINAEVSRGCVHPLKLLDRKLILDQKKPKTILSVSRLAREKRIDLLISGFKQVAERDHCVNLRIVGEGPLRRELENQVVNLGLSDRVRFLGFINDSDLEGEYASAEIFISCAYADFDLTQYEAYNYCCKIICTNEFEAEEFLVTSGNLFLCRSEIADIGRTLHHSLSTNFNLRDDVQIFSWKNKFRSVYEESLR